LILHYPKHQTLSKFANLPCRQAGCLLAIVN